MINELNNLTTLILSRYIHNFKLPCFFFSYKTHLLKSYPNIVEVSFLWIFYFFRICNIVKVSVLGLINLYELSIYNFFTWYSKIWNVIVSRTFKNLSHDYILLFRCEINWIIWKLNTHDYFTLNIMYVYIKSTKIEHNHYWSSTPNSNDCLHFSNSNKPTQRLRGRRPGAAPPHISGNPPSSRLSPPTPPPIRLQIKHMLFRKKTGQLIEDRNVYSIY